MQLVFTISKNGLLSIGTINGLGSRRKMLQNSGKFISIVLQSMHSKNLVHCRNYHAKGWQFGVGDREVTNI